MRDCASGTNRKTSRLVFLKVALLAAVVLAALAIQGTEAQPGKAGFRESSPPLLKEVGVKGVIGKAKIQGGTTASKAWIKKSFSLALPGKPVVPVQFQDVLVPVTIRHQHEWVRVGMPIPSGKSGMVAFHSHSGSPLRALRHLEGRLTKLTGPKGGKLTSPDHNQLLASLGKAVREETQHLKTRSYKQVANAPADRMVSHWQFVDVVTINYDWDKKDQAWILEHAKPTSKLSPAVMKKASASLAKHTISWPREEYRIVLRDSVDTIEAKKPAGPAK